MNGAIMHIQSPKEIMFSNGSVLLGKRILIRLNLQLEQNSIPRVNYMEGVPYTILTQPVCMG